MTQPANVAVEAAAKRAGKYLTFALAGEVYGLEILQGA